MKKLILFIQKIYYFIMSRLFCKNRVLFISFAGKQYSDNPKAVSDYLLKNHPKVKQLWLFENPKEMKHLLPKGIKCAKYTKNSIVYYIATSKVLIDNDKMVYYWKLAEMPKRKDQIFIETWHGDMGFKKCFYDTTTYKAITPFSLEKPGTFDYFVTGSEFAEPIVKSMFNYHGELLKVGCPRNDAMFKNHDEHNAKIRKQLGLSEDTKILLYAPTFRQKIPENAERIDFDALVEALEKTTKSKWSVVFRAHHMHADATNKKYIDGRKLFNDMADILIASDMLITDYSSCAGDFAHTKKPIILYVDDYEEYEKNDRGLHFKLNNSPYWFAKNNEELIKTVKSLTDKKAEKNCEDILKFYQCYEDGSSCEKIASLITKHFNKK